MFNEIKNEIINGKEIYPLKILFNLSFFFLVLSKILMFFDFFQNRAAFIKLNNFLNDNLYFNNTKIISAATYLNGVNLRWLSHSLYLNSTSCIFGDFVQFYKDLLMQNIDFLDNQKNKMANLGEYFQEKIFYKHKIGMNVYMFKNPEIYNFNLDNIITFLINIAIKIIDTFSEYYPKNCENISKELTLSEINIKNLVEISLYFYESNINGYKGKEKTKLINKIINIFPSSLVCFSIISVILFIIFSFCLNVILNVEATFLEKLVNFNSVNFDDYIKRIDEIKKNLRNDNIEEEDKGDDMDFNDGESKKKDEEEGNEKLIEKKKDRNKEEKQKSKKKKEKQSKILQQKRKKLKTMKSYFYKTNILYAIETILIMTPFILYYLITILFRNNLKNNFVEFDNIRDTMIALYKDSFDIILNLTKELEIYENNLINCKTIIDIKHMNFPKINEISSPSLGNIFMQISDSSSFEKSTLEEFVALFNGDSCELLSINSDEYKICQKFWDGILLRGIEQSLIYMGVIISNVLDELEIINDINNNETLFVLMNGTSYIQYQQFIEFYLIRAYNTTKYILKDLTKQKFASIIKKLKLLLIIYIIISLFLLLLYFYNTISFNNIFNSFINFICILPSKYISEDESFHLEIINFGKKYF